ncbi:MAG: septation protein SepH [Pseudonocardiaceae bacterium]
MRALRVVGLGIDGRTVILETVAQRSGERRERFTLPADEGLHAAVRGDLPRLGQIEIELESQMRPREIQARIRAGASVEQVAAAAGVPSQRIERFAYPVLLERSRTAQLAQQAHPVRSDGPDVRTLEEVVSETFGKRGHDYDAVTWDSWRGENGKWVVQLRWRAGRSDNKAHWTFHPGAHGGTVTALDDHATDLIDPQPAVALRPVAPVTPLNPVPEPNPATPSWEPVPQEQSPAPSQVPSPDTSQTDPQIGVPVTEEQHGARAVPDDGPAYRPPHPAERPAAEQRDQQPPTEHPAAAPPAPKRGRKDRPIVPSWEDVLLGVRSPRE